jgi:hypothetical protein
VSDRPRQADAEIVSLGAPYQTAVMVLQDTDTGLIRRRPLEAEWMGLHQIAVGIGGGDVGGRVTLMILDQLLGPASGSR